MIQAFVNGELSDADHDLMAHHISTCQECAAAVAAERVVRLEMARLSASEDTSPVSAGTFVEPSTTGSPTLPPETVVLTSGEPTGADSVPVSASADMLSEQVVQSGDLSVPPVPELQLDFILDRTSEGGEMLLPRESVREVSLDQLPAAPVHSVRRTQPAGEAEVRAEVESARVIYADDMEVAAATMAGIADSVAHGAAALASNGPPEPLVVEEAPVVEVSEPTAIEDAAIVEEQEPAVTQAADADAEVDRPQGSQPGPAVIVVPGISAAPPRSGRLWRWSAAAGLLVVAVVAAYAATQVRSSAFANAANPMDAPDPPETVSGPEVEGQTTPSVLTPILESTVYRAVSPPARTRVRPAPTTRRVRRAERLPQIVSDPPDANGSQARQPGGETLPEVVTGNAPARTTARGSAVVISGIPDVPRLLRTTTHRPRPGVAYVLRKYDAWAAEPAPRAGVNEYRWRDATGSRLYVLSGPVNVRELRAYARRLQSRDR